MTTSSTENLPKPDLKQPIHLLAFGFGAGCSPKAPGTAGTLVAVLLYLPMSVLPLALYGLLTLSAILLGILICGWSARQLGVHDHPGIVWDEMAGYWITMLAAPAGWQWIVLGFVLFRLFDILKPWPINWIDRQVTGGLGIMLDDVIAGLMAFGVVQLIRL